MYILDKSTGRFLIIAFLSGILRGKESDILPPPPPFPRFNLEDFEKEDKKRLKETEKLQRKKEDEDKRKFVEQKKNERDIRKIEERGKLMRGEEREQRNIEIKRRGFEFFHKLGLVKTEKEKKEDKEIKLQKKAEKERLRRLKLRQKEEGKKRGEELRGKRIEERRGIIKQNKQEKLMKIKERKKKRFEFFHNLGLVKTEKEKKEDKEIKLQKKAEKERLRRLKLNQKEEGRRRKEELKRKIKLGREERLKENKRLEELEMMRKEKEERKREKELEKKRYIEQKERERKAKAAERIEMKITKPGKILPSEKDIELDEELEELEKPEIKIPESPRETKWTPEVGGKTEKPEEIKKAEEEIQRAIEGIKNYKEKKSIFRSIFRPKEKPKRAGIEELPLPPKFMPKTYEKRDEVDDILNLIHEARNVLMEFDLDKAKSAYIEIMRSYNGLSVDEKKKVYQDIKDLYDERKNAEALNIR